MIRLLMIILFLEAALLSTAFGAPNCTMSFPKPKGGPMSVTYIGKNLHHELLRILEDKGYEILDPIADRGVKATYSLTVFGSYGYGCGTGLKWYDHLLIPAGAEMRFNGPQGKIEKNHDYTGPGLVAVKLAKKKLKKMMNSLPECRE